MRDSINPAENFQQYTIINSKFSFEGGCAKFMYRGYEISFSTKGYQEGACLNEVCVFHDENTVPVLKTHTVQEAIEQVNNIFDSK